MPLDLLHVERYRCFAGGVDLQLRPLTLIFGRNSSGKSALVRALPLLAASARSEAHSPLDLASNGARGASYKEIASRFAQRNALVFGLRWRGPGAVTELSVQLRDMPERRLQIVEHLRATVGGEQIDAEFQPVEAGDQYELRVGDASTNVAISFKGLRPQAEPATPETKSTRVLSEISARLLEFSSTVHWLTAVREAVPRRTQETDATLGPSGKGTDSILAADWRHERRLFDEINPIYGRMFGHELRVDEDVEGLSLEVIPTSGDPIPTAVADSGEGETQVLPVLLMCALAKTRQLGQDPVLVLEQPEMHLHPAAERELGELFFDVVTAGSATIVVETHSENLLLFVQLAIAEGRLPAENVAVYYVRQQEGGPGSVVDEIKIDNMGRPANWPPGVFSEDVALARELLLVQRRRLSSP